jgi:hypothetical protein
MYYKVISENNQSFNGGDFDWSSYLPKKNKKGKWTPKIKNLSMCYSGYHITKYWNMWIQNKNDKIFEVEYRDLKEENEIGVNIKSVCSQLRLIKQIIPDYKKDLNTGNSNTGDSNTGDRNTGNWNTGKATVTPATGTPATVTPATVTPATGTPATVTPATGTPATGTPATVTPATVTPATGTPATGTPATGTPATGTPATVTPATGTPATGTPATVTPAVLIQKNLNIMNYLIKK